MLFLSMLSSFCSVLPMNDVSLIKKEQFFLRPHPNIRTSTARVPSARIAQKIQRANDRALAKGSGLNPQYAPPLKKNKDNSKLVWSGGAHL